MDFDGDLHGKDGPVPIRRTRQDDWAPLSKAVHAYAQERQIPFIADMNADFRDGYGSVPMSNWPRQARVGGDLLSRRGGARAQQSDHHQRRDRDRASCSTAAASPASTRGSAARSKQFTAREVILSLGGIHSPAFLMRIGHRAGASICASTASRCAPICPASATICPTTPSCSSACCRSRGARQAESLRPHPMTAFRYSSGLPGAPRDRHVHQRAVQDLVERRSASRSPISRPRCSSRWRAGGSR